MVESTNAVLQQDELHDVADLLKVHLSEQHVDGVGGGEDEGEEEEADGVTFHWDSALAARGGEATTPENLLWYFGVHSSGEVGCLTGFHLTAMSRRATGTGPRARGRRRTIKTETAPSGDPGSSLTEQKSPRPCQIKSAIPNT